MKFITVDPNALGSSGRLSNALSVLFGSSHIELRGGLHSGNFTLRYPAMLVGSGDARVRGQILVEKNATVTLDGLAFENGSDPALVIDDGCTVVVRNCTFSSDAGSLIHSRGYVQLKNCTFAAFGGSSAIYIEKGQMVASQCEARGNGRFADVGPNASLILIDCTLRALPQWINADRLAHLDIANCDLSATGTGKVLILICETAALKMRGCTCTGGDNMVIYVQADAVADLQDVDINGGGESPAIFAHGRLDLRGCTFRTVLKVDGVGGQAIAVAAEVECKNTELVQLKAEACRFERVGQAFLIDTGATAIIRDCDISGADVVARPAIRSDGLLTIDDVRVVSYPGTALIVSDGKCVADGFVTAGHSVDFGVWCLGGELTLKRPQLNARYNALICDGGMTSITDGSLSAEKAATVTVKELACVNLIGTEVVSLMDLALMNQGAGLLSATRVYARTLSSEHAAVSISETSRIELTDCVIEAPIAAIVATDESRLVVKGGEFKIGGNTAISLRGSPDITARDLVVRYTGAMAAPVLSFAGDGRELPTGCEAIGFARTPMAGALPLPPTVSSATTMTLPPDLASALAELDSLTGLAPIKAQINAMVDLLSVRRRREAAGRKVAPVTLHMVFTGNPGTGKTTVARLIGRIYAALGLLKTDKLVEVQRSDIIANIIGGTAINTKKAVDAAMDGVLFIDEAYSLVQEGSSEFGAEAISTLLPLMENNRDRLCVIAAGYTDLMRVLIASNPGLKSRFTRSLEFPDYTPKELEVIFRSVSTDAGYYLDSAAAAMLPDRLRQLRLIEGKDFGNARSVRSFFEATVERQSSRVARDSAADFDELRGVDLPEYVAAARPIEEILADLDKLVGLNTVKREVHGFVALAQVNERRHAAGLPVQHMSLHMMFTGNPGTGKTTVAALFGEIYAALRLLPASKLILAERKDLVAGYIGQTAIKTQERIDAARGGVLFIDEAYTLTSDDDRDFGQEAITTLLSAMERDREMLAVIAAGYTADMKGFLASNPGLASRMTRIIDFPDYNVDELVEIFARMCASGSYRLESAVRERVSEVIRTGWQQRNAHFGNGRSVRAFYEAMLLQHAVRLAASAEADPSILQIADIPASLIGAPEVAAG